MDIDKLRKDLLARVDVDIAFDSPSPVSPFELRALLDHIDNLTLSAKHSADVATQAIARAEAAEAKVTELSNDVHTLTGEASTYKRERDEIRAELARLRDLFRLDGEQHANHVKELTKAHEARITKYADELTRLRAPVEGEVGEVVEAINDFCWGKDEAAIAVRAADLLQRLAGQVKTVLDRETATTARYDAKLDAAEARLREAGEVMEDIDFIARTTSGLGYEVIHRYARAFTAKLSPAPEPVREDTYPDRVSMEPWPHIGHAPGGSDADQ